MGERLDPDMGVHMGLQASHIRAGLGSGLSIVMLSLGTGSPATASDPARDAGSAPDRPELVHTFVSAPDLMNGDIGDVRSSPYWKRGMPNSWNRSWAQNVDNVFGQLASHDADSYLVAGDLVDGHWHKDRGTSGVFGPGRTHQQRLARITTAGRVYYREWRRFWRDAGVPMSRVHTAVGDHEVGDNPWNPGKLKHAAFERFKSVYASNFTMSGKRHRYRLHPVGTKFDRTAYATYLGPQVLLVTVDVFDRTRSGVRATVNHGQLAWLDRTLAKVPDDVTVLVQGHTPVLTPIRQRASSGLIMDAGREADSPFWQTLRRHDVDLYLTGEVHDFTAVSRGEGEPVQVSHGGYAATGRTDYLVGKVYDDGSVELETFTIDRTWRSPSSLWQTNRTIVPKHLRTARTSRSVGTMRITGDRTIERRTGCLDVWSEIADSCTAPTPAPAG